MINDFNKSRKMVFSLFLYIAAICLISSKSVSYVIVVNNSNRSQPFLLNADNYLPKDRSNRNYYINVDKSANFVRKILSIEPLTGSLKLKQPLDCSGINYPNLFTLYVDSISNGSVEYLSLPFRIYVKGCEELSNDFVQLKDFYNKKITDIKSWTSETLVSYALPGNKIPSTEPLFEICFQKGNKIFDLDDYAIPKLVSKECSMKYLDISDARLSVNKSTVELTTISNFCIPLDPPWKIKILISFQCNNFGAELIAPLNHYIKLVLWRRKELNEVGRVRRDINNGGTVSDNKAPQFEKALYIASVNEEQPPNLSVCTVHAKSVDGAEVSYQMVPLLDGRSHSMFAIDSTSGLVTTSVSLDREQLDVHYFRVQAVDMSYRSHSATTTLQINVADVNDHAPVFESANGQYEASVRELIAIGSIVTTVRATDKDIGHNAEIEYNIHSIDGAGIVSGSSEAFSIDGKSGVLATRLPLDRELTEVYTIVVTATDQALPITDRKSSSATIIVKVLDENDNYPQFAERTYSVTVPENTSITQNPVIAVVRATDLDQDQNAAIRYAIIGGNTQGQFSIDSQSGEVTLIKPLDYEAVKNYRLIIRAQDGGSPSRSNTTQLLVNVKDVNDNTPRFYTSLFQESVLENVPVGYSIVRVQAYDADEGENAVLKYLISDRDSQGTPSADLPVAVDENSGWIYVTKNLDREVNSKYQFQILAQDGGVPPRTATASVVINVQDVNDNDPTFSPKVYEAVVSESDPPGTPVTTVIATDPDENPRLHYEISNGNVRSRFAITTQNGRGLITIAQPLDYKQEKRFILNVKAIDSGGRYDTATVYVNVSDANNFSPVFENAPYTASVFEDVPIGSTVLIVTATDGDVGQNAQITYSLASGIGEAPEFTINPQTGAIITTRPLDRETQSAYILTVTAKDGGVPSFSDTTDVEISVVDINDNAPVFSKSSYFGSVSEDALVGTSVLQVGAMDADTGLNARIRYALDSNVEAFVIDSTSGVIRTATALDRESVAQYDFKAIAMDRGTPSLTSSVPVTVKIEDVNDSPPTFSSDKLVFYIPENSPIGSLVGELYAHDPDEGPNAVVEYSIIGGEDATSFALAKRQGSEKAELLTTVELDYESPKKSFNLVVRASSPPLRNDAHVEVIVTDVNDNAPRLKDFYVIFNNFKDCFPIGPFGRVPAFDADVTDKLRYRILSGNNANLVHLNESSGELTLSSQLNTNVPKTAMIEMFVTDGVNEVKASMQLMVRLVTEEMLFNSVTVRLNDMTQEAFLSPLFWYFVEGLAAIIPCPKDNVYVFSVANDTNVKDRILKVSFSARKPDGSFYSPQYLQEKVYLNRMILAKLSTLQILPFDDNLCVYEPCLNYEQCQSVLKFGNASGFVNSDSILFRPIYPVSTFACQCPVGFLGKHEYYLCDTEVNLCYSNPCQNGGKCHQKEGGYTCICPPNYIGDNCEIQLKSNVCHPFACHSGSVCTALSQGGFVCDDCSVTNGQSSSSSDDDRLCQLRGRSFTRHSFLTFPPLKRRNRFHLMLKFATLENSGLLLYNGRYNEKHDFIALEITDGGQSVQFSFSLGADVTRVTASSIAGVNDGNWHSVVVTYYNRTATLSLDDCDTALTIKYGPQMGYLCANHSSQILEARCELITEACYRLLDLTGPLQIGGLPSFSQATTFQVQSKDYVGCISDVYIDYKLIDLNSFVADNGTVVGCPERKPQCNDHPCQNGGTCSDSWDTFHCNCPEGWTGKDCGQATGFAWQFNGEGMLLFNPLLRSVQLPWTVSLSLRTLQTEAFIVSVQVGQNSTTMILLEGGYIVYAIDGQSLTLPKVRVNDGFWHHVEVTWLSGGTSSVKLGLDYGKHSVVRMLNAKIQGLYIGKVIFGNFEDDNKSESNSKRFPGFSGCLLDVKIGSSHALQRPTIISHVTEGCSAIDPCLENKCPNNSDCVPAWEKYSCKCHKGFVGPACTPVCNTNPCSNGAQCAEDKNHFRGYKCLCNSSYYTGDYCETEVERSCPVTWWGDPVCGPCNCAVELGYNPECNKTNGQCSCKENHYRPEGSKRCLPCDCYLSGSNDATCDPYTGQCRCRPGVIGRRCTSCPNPYAEISLRGCEVVYDGCPQNYADDILWPRTNFGLTAVEWCPKGSHGKVSRICDSEFGLWKEADIFNCTSDSFLEMRKLLTELNDGSMTITPYLAIESANLISKAVNSTNTLHGADIMIAEQMIRKLLDYEETQTGLNLTHIQDKDYIQNIILGISRIINSDEFSHWNHLEKLSHETTELLLMSVLKYLTVLVSNQHDTYTDPFEVVTTNLVLGLDVVTMESVLGYETDGIQLDMPLDMLGKYREKVELPDTSLFTDSSEIQIGALKTGYPTSGAKSINSPAIILPKYNNYLMDKSKFDSYTQIVIPIDLLGIRNVHQGEISSKEELLHSDNAVVGYVQYRNIGAILPLKFDVTVVKRWGVDLVVGSPVISVVAAINRHYHEAPQPSSSTLLNSVPLTSPIRLRIWLNVEHISPQLNPQCVRWSTAKGFGEWTRMGCITGLPDLQYTKKPMSPILINCTCNQFSTHAVLVDVIENEYVIEFSSTEDISLWVSYSMAITALSIGWILLLFLRANTNSSSICINLIFCLLLVQCLYIFALKSKITVVSNEVICRLSAMGLHYLWLTVLSWSLVNSWHLYRMLTEMRDVNHGQMTFYHSMGYGLPAVVVALSVGIRANQYGNYFFCWLSLYESVVWSLIGPVCMLVVGNLIVLLISLRAAFALKNHVAGYGNLRTLLWLNVISLPLLVSVWMLELITGTERNAVITYSLCLLIILQAWFMLCGYCFGNSRIRMSLNRLFLRMLGRKVPPLPEEDIDIPIRASSHHQIPRNTPRSALAYRNASVNTFESARRQIGIIASSTTSRSTSKTTSSPYRSDTQLRNTSTSTSNYENSDGPSAFHPVQHTSDSDSEASVERRSLDLASSHSSDEEDSSRSRHRSRRNVGVSTSAAAPQVSTTPSYLPDIMEDIMVSSSSNLPGARLASIEPPEHLNVIANSQLFPNLKPNYYSPRWNRQRVDPCNTVVEEEPYSHRWTTSDNENNALPQQHIDYESSTLRVEDKYAMQQAENSSSPLYEENISYCDKYSFPYTAEEDHCGSPYLNALRSVSAATTGMPASGRNLGSCSQNNSNSDFQRISSNRTSVRSNAIRMIGGTEAQYNQRIDNVDSAGGGIVSDMVSMRSIDLNRDHDGSPLNRIGYEDIALHNAYRRGSADRVGNEEVNRNLDETSVNSYSLRRGSDISLRSIERYHHHHHHHQRGAAPNFELPPLIVSSRRNSGDVNSSSNSMMNNLSIPMQRRPICSPSNVVIDDDDDLMDTTEKDITTEETRV